MMADAEQVNLHFVAEGKDAAAANARRRGEAPQLLWPPLRALLRQHGFTLAANVSRRCLYQYYPPSYKSEHTRARNGDVPSILWHDCNFFVAFMNCTACGEGAGADPAAARVLAGLQRTAAEIDRGTEEPDEGVPDGTAAIGGGGRLRGGGGHSECGAWGRPRRWRAMAARAAPPAAAPPTPALSAQR
eukprot:gene54602-11709_t